MAETLDEAKTKPTEAVDRLADDLEKISHQINATPEFAKTRGQLPRLEGIRRRGVRGELSSPD